MQMVLYFLTSLSPYLVYILRVSSGILDSLARPCSHETFVIYPAGTCTVPVFDLMGIWEFDC